MIYTVRNTTTGDYRIFTIKELADECYEKWSKQIGEEYVTIET